MNLNGTLSGAKGLTASVSGSSSIGGSLSLPESRAGGTTDYELLKNKPSINDVELKGNKTFDELGMVEVTNLEIDALFKQYF